jgi:hypothetical protein
MADNTELNVGSGGDVIATDDIGGVKHQRVKVQHGVDGAADDVSANNPLPVVMPETMRDAFGRLRTSEPHTIFDSKQIFDSQPLFWDESLESGAGITSAHSTARASTTITSTISTAGVYTRQTYERFNYQPGKSQMILMTGIMDRLGGGTGVQRRIGQFDDDNGIFFEDDEGTFKVVVRSSTSGSPVDTKVAQSSFNLDTLDGTGASGVTIDLSKAQIFIIDYEWLGVGRVRLGLAVGGEIIYCHEVLNANVLDVVYMSTPNNPLRYQIVTTGSSLASELECNCSTVITEGGATHLGQLRFKSTAGTHVDVAVENTIYAIIGMRLKSTHLGETIDILKKSIAEHAGNKNYEWLLIFNPTVAGTFTYSNETNSAVQTATGATANTVTGGTIIDGGFAASANKGGSESSNLENAIRLGAAIDGTVDEIVLCVRPVGGSSNIDIEASIAWRERQ